MSKRLDDWIINKMPRIVIALSAIALALGIVATYTLIQTQEAKDKVDTNQTETVQALRENQYINCVRSANGLRRQVRREFVDLKREVLIPVFSRVAATLPAGAPAKRILTGTVVYMHKRIRTIESRIPNVPCLKRYPPLPGQTYSKVRPNKQNGGGDARSTSSRPSGPSDSNSGSGPSPSQPSSPAGGGDGDGGTQPPTGSPPSPPGPPTDPPPPPPPDPVDPPSQPPPQGPLDSLQNGLNDTVNGAQDTVNGAVNGVQGTTCKLGVLC